MLDSKPMQIVMLLLDHLVDSVMDGDLSLLPTRLTQLWVPREYSVVSKPWLKAALLHFFDLQVLLELFSVLLPLVDFGDEPILKWYPTSFIPASG